MTQDAHFDRHLAALAQQLTELRAGGDDAARPTVTHIHRRVSEQLRTTPEPLALVRWQHACRAEAAVQLEATLAAHTPLARAAYAGGRDALA